MTEEDKKDFNTQVPTKEYIEWKYFTCEDTDGKFYDYRYFCDENILKSLGIKPTN